MLGRGVGRAVLRKVCRCQRWQCDGFGSFPASARWARPRPTPGLPPGALSFSSNKHRKENKTQELRPAEPAQPAERGSASKRTLRLQLSRLRLQNLRGPHLGYRRCRSAAKVGLELNNALPDCPKGPNRTQPPSLSPKTAQDFLQRPRHVPLSLSVSKTAGCAAGKLTLTDPHCTKSLPLPSAPASGPRRPREGVESHGRHFRIQRSVAFVAFASPWLRAPLARSAASWPWPQRLKRGRRPASASARTWTWHGLAPAPSEAASGDGGAFLAGVCCLATGIHSRFQVADTWLT